MSLLFLIRQQTRNSFIISRLMAALQHLLLRLQFRPTSTTFPTSWMRWALVYQTKCPPPRCPVPRPGGVAALQSLHLPLLRDMALAQRHLLPVLLRPRFQGNVTDDTPASMGINGAFLVNAPLRVSTLTLATPAVAASGHHGALIQVAYHVCATPLPDTIPR